MELNLSKSKYCNVAQCPKMLWMSVNHPELYDDPHPDEQIVFRYSLHYIEYEGGPAASQVVPRRAGRGSAPLVRDMTFFGTTWEEARRHQHAVSKGLARLYPDLADQAERKVFVHDGKLSEKEER